MSLLAYGELGNSMARFLNYLCDDQAGLLTSRLPGGICPFTCSMISVSDCHREVLLDVSCIHTFPGGAHFAN